MLHPAKARLITAIYSPPRPPTESRCQMAGRPPRQESCQWPSTSIPVAFSARVAVLFAQCGGIRGSRFRVVVFAPHSCLPVPSSAMAEAKDVYCVRPWEVGGPIDPFVGTSCPRVLRREKFPIDGRPTGTPGQRRRGARGGPVLKGQMGKRFRRRCRSCSLLSIAWHSGACQQLSISDTDEVVPCSSWICISSSIALQTRRQGRARSTS